MKIKKVKLLDGGFRGAEIEYHKLEKNNGRLFNNKHKPTLKFPVHLELEKKFKELRPFMLELCNVLDGSEEVDEKKYKMLYSEVVSVSFLDNGFLLGGETVSIGNTRAYHETPKVYGDTGYKDFDAVRLILNELLKELQVYIEGTAKPSDEEVLIRWVERHENSGIDIDTIKGMSPEDQKKQLTELLEKAGAVVMWNEEMEVDTEVLSDGLEEMKKDLEEEVIVKKYTDENTKGVVAEHIPVTEESSTVNEEETSFTLPEVGDELSLEPIKQPVKTKK